MSGAGETGGAGCAIGGRWAGWASRFLCKIANLKGHVNESLNQLDRLPLFNERAAGHRLDVVVVFGVMWTRICASQAKPSGPAHVTLGASRRVAVCVVRHLVSLRDGPAVRVVPRARHAPRGERAEAGGGRRPAGGEEPPPPQEGAVTFSFSPPPVEQCFSSDHLTRMKWSGVWHRNVFQLSFSHPETKFDCRFAQ